MPGARLPRVYRDVALFWLNACVLVLVANLLAAAWLAWQGTRPAAPPPVDQKPLQRFFPGWSEADLAAFLRESTQTFQYEPFTQFRERRREGRYVNVEVAGFRRSAGQGPWPIDPANLNVFLFGGSTTFGYGVPDEYTIASYLQRRLAGGAGARPPRVYNFGRGAYHSAQEHVLFERLLATGAVPDIAIFIDGLNDFHFKDGEPALTPWLEGVVEHRGEPPANPYAVVLDALPLVRAFGLRRGLQTDAGYPSVPNVPQKPAPFDDPTVLDAVIDRYFANKKLSEGAAAAFGVQVLFVWQPVPTYAYPFAVPADAKRLGAHEYSRHGYPRMAERIARTPPGRDFVWCADIHADLGEPAYVDNVHYSPAMSDRLARCIADGLHERRVVEATRR